MVNYLSYLTDYDYIRHVKAMKKGCCHDAINEIIFISKVSSKSKILELGSGSGTFTKELVDRGYANIKCVEISKELSTHAKRKLDYVSSINIYNQSIEKFNDGDKYDLVISTTLLDREELGKYVERLSGFLKPGGTLALVLSIHVKSYCPLWSNIRNIYKTYAPELSDDYLASSHDQIDYIIKSLGQENRFHNITNRDFEWIEDYTADEYLQFLHLTNIHSRLEPDTKQILLKNIRSSIQSSGGMIRKPHFMTVITCKKM